MANDRDSRDESRLTDEQGNRREIGEGMHSPDSTQMPLKAENAEPDWRAVKGGNPNKEHNESDRDSDRDRDRQSNR
jgi:hypothetical protein